MSDTNKHTANFIKELRSNGRYAFTDNDLFQSVDKDKRILEKI